MGVFYNGYIFRCLDGDKRMRILNVEEYEKELKHIDDLIWWVDFGQYVGCKEITVPKFREITAEQLVE